MSIKFEKTYNELTIYHICQAQKNRETWPDELTLTAKCIYLQPIIKQMLRQYYTLRTAVDLKVIYQMSL